MAQGIPEGASAVIPRLFCRDVVAEIEFCTATFGAKEGVRRPGADGRIAHALVMFGPAMMMIESEWPGATNRAPAPDGSSSVALYVYVENVDQTVERAVTRGARILMPAANQFWGDRTAWILDPSGHVWTVATRIEETTEEQRQERLALSKGKSTPKDREIGDEAHQETRGCGGKSGLPYRRGKRNAAK
jgi:PhnB protein